MSHKLCSVLLLGICLLLLGCGGGNTPDATVAVAPPAPPPVATPPVDPPSDVVKPAPIAPTETPTTDPTTELPADVARDNPAPNTGEPVNLIAAEGPLAAHARALSIVRPEHYTIIKFDLEAARQTKLVKDLPEGSAEIAQELGSDADADFLADKMVDIDILWLAIGPANAALANASAPPFTFGAYARFKTGESLQEAVTEVVGNNQMVEAVHNGTKYQRPEIPGDGPVFFTEDRELFLAVDEATIQHIIDAQGKIADMPLLTKLKGAPLDAQVLIAGSLGPMREPVTQMLTETIRESGLPLAPTTAQLPAQIDFATIVIDLDGEILIDIDAEMDKPQNAVVMKETLTGLVSLGKLMLGQMRGQVGDDPAGQQMFALWTSLSNAVKIDQNDAHVDVSLARVPELDALPEIIATAQGAAETAVSLNNGRMLALAALNYHHTMRKFPANMKNEAGEEVLSWRVSLLPFIEENILYDSLNKESAWNSPANEEWTATPIAILKTPASEAIHTTTWKMLPDMPGDMLFIETGAGTAVPWAKPETFVIDPANPAVSLGEEPEDGYVVVFRDGRVQRLTAEQIKEKLSGEASAEPVIDTPDPTVDGPDVGVDPVDPKPAPVEREVRTWTTADGKNSVEATFVKLIGGKITLRRADNNMEVTLPVVALSAADQDYLKSLKK